MNLKRILALTLLFVLLAAACSCGKKDTDGPRPSYDSDGVYTCFSDIPENYNADMAIKDGCVVIDTVEHEERIATGYEHFEKFIQEAEQKKNSFVRVAHFIDGIGYYTDLYYHDGKYLHFKFDDKSVPSNGESYMYLRRLDSEENKKHCLYVLTDSIDLTYSDVMKQKFSSSILPSSISSDPPHKPYLWLGFTTYFN